ncbi:helix-turn-helix domain-containing protein [Arabiibacter massiliensis]|uniref:helix-turn-helix domain-containing protein n=1 Tax=Arabiibacter massiliensis TaxID=1870985 RepID=UPI001179E741|nr:helix-turn-helix domain-containing protein [Arabiibacter massiliensis]
MSIITNQMKEIMANTLVDTNDAAKLLNLSARRMRQLALDGNVKAEKIGNCWAFDIEDLKRYRNLEQ